MIAREFFILSATNLHTPKIIEDYCTDFRNMAYNKYKEIDYENKQKTMAKSSASIEKL